MRAGIGVRCVEDINTTRLQAACDEVHVRGEVIWMQMLEELIAEGDIDRAGRQIEVETIKNFEVEIRRADEAWSALIGDVSSEHLAHFFRHRTGKAAVSWSDLHEDGVLL